MAPRSLNAIAHPYDIASLENPRISLPSETALFLVSLWLYWQLVAHNDKHKFYHSREVLHDIWGQHNIRKCHCCRCGTSNTRLNCCYSTVLWQKDCQHRVSWRRRLVSSRISGKLILRASQIEHLHPDQILTFGMGIMMIVGKQHLVLPESWQVFTFIQRLCIGRPRTTNTSKPWPQRLPEFYKWFNNPHWKGKMLPSKCVLGNVY